VSGVPDEADEARPWPARRVLEAVLPWALVMALGIGFLGGLLDHGLLTRPGQRPPAALAQALGALAARLPSAPPSASTERAALQRAFEDTLAGLPELQAIDWLAPDGRVWMSTEPSASGRAAAEGLGQPEWRLPAAGAGLRVLFVDGAAAPDGQRPGGWPVVVALAIGLPLAAVIVLLLRPPRAAPSAAVRAAQARLLATRQRLGRAAQELEWLEASASSAAAETGIFTRTGAFTQSRRPGGVR